MFRRARLRDWLTLLLVVLVLSETLLYMDLLQRYTQLQRSFSELHSILRGIRPFRTPFNASDVKAFLEAQYVPEAGLLRAATIAVPDAERIYVASDNLLASRALQVLGSQIAYNVCRTLDLYYNGGFDGQHEILIGVRAEHIGGATGLVVYNKTIYSEKFGMEFTICREVHETGGNSYDKYADLIVYVALKRLMSGDFEEAKTLMDLLMDMWDGYGFRDTAWEAENLYESYKLALAVYLWRALNAAKPSYTKYADVIARITEIAYYVCTDWKRGIRTHYRVVDGRVIPEGDCNVETTSIYVLAYLSDYPVRIGLMSQKNWDKTVEDFRAYPLTFPTQTLNAPKKVHEKPVKAS